MDSEIFIGLITLVGTIFSGIIGVVSAQKVISVKIDELSKRVDKHNSIIERTYSLENRLTAVEISLDELKEDICELKSKKGN